MTMRRLTLAVGAVLTTGLTALLTVIACSGGTTQVVDEVWDDVGLAMRVNGKG